MDTQTHKILDFIEHLWPLLAGLAATLIGAVRLWWMNHKSVQEQFREQREAIIAITESMATKEELHNCRENVRSDDKEILQELKNLRDSNQEQHDLIKDQIINLHGRQQ